MMKTLILATIIVASALVTGCAQSGEMASISPLSYSPISQEISRKVSSNWFIHPKMLVQNEGPLVVHISLKRDGSLASANIVRSSGNVPFDDSLLRAVRKSQPFPIPPEQVATYREFELEFDHPIHTQPLQ